MSTHSRGKRILDIGSGTGEFLNYCEKKGLVCQGTELADKAREWSVRTYGIKAEKNLSTLCNNNRQYDCITMWHVLEHIHALDETMSMIMTLLDKNGILVAALPNSTAFDAVYYHHYWAAYDLPRHLYHFNQASVEKLAQKYSLQVVNRFPQWYDAFYISMLSEKYKTGSSNLLKACVIGLLSDFYGLTRDTGFSSQIYLLTRKNA